MKACNIWRYSQTNSIGFLIEADWRICTSVNVTSLVQIIACCLFSDKPLSESMLDYGPFESKHSIFHWRKCNWRCLLQKYQPSCLDLNVLIHWISYPLRLSSSLATVANTVSSWQESNFAQCFYSRYDVLPPNIVKSRSCEIGCCNVRIALKFDMHLGNAAAEVSKFQSDWKSLNSNLALSRLHEYLW